MASSICTTCSTSTMAIIVLFSLGISTFLDLRLRIFLRGLSQLSNTSSWPSASACSTANWFSSRNKEARQSWCHSSQPEPNSCCCNTPKKWNRFMGETVLLSLVHQKQNGSAAQHAVHGVWIHMWRVVISVQCPERLLSLSLASTQLILS